MKEESATHLSLLVYRFWHGAEAWQEVEEGRSLELEARIKPWFELD